MRTVDKSPVDGFNFYRMKMVLENGTALYSPVRIVSFDVPLDFTIFPNPASTEIFIQLSEPPSEEMTWTVYDALGRPIWSQDILQDAAFPYRIDAQFFEAGIYYLYAQRAGMRAVGKRFVITR
ncbi:MAG: T9SS type A sorting domain-containing protein [Lewinellaceae bacterium]|nr:T9SS type A sorting domain-containing protein [Lewinellaceae bacterium]